MVDLSWSPPLPSKQNGIIINYIIYISDEESGCQFQESTSNTSITTNENLHPYHTYKCVMGAETSVGLGPFSSAIFFTTHEDGKLTIMEWYTLYRLVCVSKSLR